MKSGSCGVRTRCVHALPVRISRTLLPLGAGVAVAMLAWWGPLPEGAGHRFSSHMVLHMLIVGVAASRLR